MKLSLLPVCAIGALVLGGCVTTPKRHVPTEAELWKKADANGDGKVSRSEYQDFMIEQLFAMYDDSGDGLITLEEYVNDGGTAVEFKKLNVSGTGKLSLTEAKASPLLRSRMAIPFDEADKDHSGFISWEEFVAADQKRRAVERQG